MMGVNSRGRAAWVAAMVSPSSLLVAFLLNLPPNLVDDGRLVLERQFRYPHGREFIEIPAGKLEPGEPPLETARRELLEETGYSAGEWSRLGVIHPSIAYTDEAIELFLAKGLEQRAAKLDAGEFLEVLRVPFDEAIAMIRDGSITDSKTIVGLLWCSMGWPSP